ncbi:MAG TPA: phosphotransferase [Elusimicrobiota bacterium]|nr:phosphotransferase [Elusimicrobiota bacterium]
MELLTNCLHGSEIASYRLHSGGQPLFRKVATTPAGISDLEREFQGLRWYFQRRYGGQPDSPVDYRIRNRYYRVERPWVDGTTGDYGRPLRANSEEIRAAVAHYVSLWPGSPENVPIHGDYSLANVVFNAEGLHVLDWEHFQNAGGDWGFDALHLVLESIWFHKRRGGPLTAAAFGPLQPAVRLLANSGLLSAVYREKPLTRIRGFIERHAAFWDQQLTLNRAKLPVLLFSSEEVQAVDRLLSAAFQDSR